MGVEYAYRVTPDPANFDSALTLARQLMEGLGAQHWISVRLFSAEPSHLVRVSEELGGGVSWKSPKGSPTKAEVDQVAAHFFDIVRRSKERGEFRFQIDCRFKGAPKPSQRSPRQSFSFMRNEHWTGSVDITCGVVDSVAEGRRRWKFYKQALFALRLVDVWRILSEDRSIFSKMTEWAASGFRSAIDDTNLRIQIWDRDLEPANLALTPATLDRAISMFNILTDELVDELHGYEVTVGGRPDPPSNESIMSLVPKTGGSFAFHGLIRKDLDDIYLRGLDAIAHSLDLTWIWIPAATAGKGSNGVEADSPPLFDTFLKKEDGRYVVFVRSKAFKDAKNVELLQHRHALQLALMPEHSSAWQSAG